MMASFVLSLTAQRASKESLSLWYIHVFGLLSVS